MATFNSEAYNGRTIVRPTGNGLFSFSSTIVVPANTAIAAADVFNFFYLAPDTFINTLDTYNDDFDDSTDALWDLGYTGVTDFFVDGVSLQTAQSIRYANNASYGTAFADGAYTPQTSGTRLVTGVVAVAPVTQTTAQLSDRRITVSGTFYSKTVAAPKGYYTPVRIANTSTQQAS